MMRNAGISTLSEERRFKQWIQIFLQFKLGCVVCRGRNMSAWKTLKNNLKYNYRLFWIWWGTQAFQHSAQWGGLNNGSKYCCNSSPAVLSAEGEIWALEKIAVDTILFSGILQLDGAGQIYYLDNEDNSEARDLNHWPICFCQHHKSTFLRWLVAWARSHICQN